MKASRRSHGDEIPGIWLFQKLVVPLHSQLARKGFVSLWRKVFKSSVSGFVFERGLEVVIFDIFHN